VCKPVETGDRQTEDVGGDRRNQHNVVRLPRDWLGPREELVPVGPAAGPAAPLGEDGLPPTAEAFWSEDSAALHDAVRAPTGQPASQWGAQGRPPSRRPRARPARRSRMGRHSMPRVPAVKLRPSPRWALLTLPIGALLVVALLGSTAKPASPQAGRQSASAAAPRQAVSGAAARLSVSPAAAHAAEQRSVTSTPRQHRGHAASAPAHARHLRSRATHRNRPRSRASSGSSPAPTAPSPSRPTYVAAPAESSPTSGDSNTPSGATSSAGAGSTTSPPANHTATSASHTPFGENGTLGPGSSPDS